MIAGRNHHDVTGKRVDLQSQLVAQSSVRIKRIGTGRSRDAHERRFSNT